MSEGQPARIMVVSGGADGINLILSTKVRLSKEFHALSQDPRLYLVVSIVSRGSQLMPQRPTGVLAIFERIFAIRGIKPILGTVVEHPKTFLALIAADGRRNPKNKIIWYTTGGAQD